jgi:hypothetical protein
VALFAPAGHGGTALQLHKRMRRTARAAGLIRFRKIYLLGRQSFFAVNRGPGRRRMPAVQKLLVDIFMATAAIPGREFGGNYEAVVILLFLAGGGLVAIQAIHAFTGVQAQFVLMDHRILSAGVTFGTLAAGAHKLRAGLFRFNLWPRPVQQERGYDQREGNHNGQEDGAKEHFHLYPTANSKSACKSGDATSAL